MPDEGEYLDRIPELHEFIGEELHLSDGDGVHYLDPTELPISLTRAETVQEQCMDVVWKTDVASTGRHDSSLFEFEEGVASGRHLRVRDLVQVVLPEKLRARVFHLAQNSLLAAHPGRPVCTFLYVRYTSAANGSRFHGHHA